MIKIVNKDGRELVVTKGVYEDLYKPLGYTMKSENKQKETKSVENDIKFETKANDDKVDNEIKQDVRRK